MRHPLLVAKTFLRHPDFVVVAFCCIFSGMAYSFVLPFSSIFGIREVGMGPGLYGFFMAVTSVSGIAISTLLARWSDTRWSRKTLLLIGGVAGVLGYVGYAWVREVWLLFLIGSVLLGISSITFSQLFAHARDLLDQSDVEPVLVPLYMNIFRLFFALSWTIGPALSAWVMGAYAFRGTYLAAAGFLAVFVLLVAFRVPSVPPSSASRQAAEKMPLKEAIRLPGLAAGFLAFTAFFMCSTMGMMNLPLLILESLHGDESHVGIAYSLAPVFEIPFMYYLGVLATRMDTTRIIKGAFLLGIVYYGGLSLVGAPWHVYPLQILSAAIVAATSGIAMAYFQDLLPDQAGTATNLFVNAMRIGSTLGFLLFGSLTAAFGYRAVFVVCALLCGFSLFLMAQVRPAIRPAAST
jgi:MFS transporter, SET family, sugar efflux transporter